MCSKCPINIRIVNKYHGHKPDGIRKIDIMRGSPLGNPYKVDVYGDRDACIGAFQSYLNQQIAINNIEILNALNHIYEMAISGGVDLICCCVPQACHGDIIKQTILNKFKENTNA